MQIQPRPLIIWKKNELNADIVRNAPETQNHFFLVPKVVE